MLRRDEERKEKIHTVIINHHSFSQSFIHSVFQSFIESI